MMSNEFKGLIIATLFACLIWELDEKQTMKKIKKKKRIEQQKQREK